MMVSPNQLVEGHLNLIAQVVNVERRAHGYSLEDAESIAGLALVQAAHNWHDYCSRKGFDPEAINYFPSYAYKRMRGAITDEWRDLDSLKRQDRKRQRENPDWVPANAAYRRPLYIEDEDGYGLPSVQDSADTALGALTMQRAERCLQRLSEGFVVALALKLKHQAQLWHQRPERGGVVAIIAALYVQECLAETLGCPVLLTDEILNERRNFIRWAREWKDEGLEERIGSTADTVVEEFYHDLHSDIGVLVEIMSLARESIVRRKAFKERQDKRKRDA